MANEADDLLKRLLDEVLEGRRALGEGIEGVGNRLDSFRNETLSNFDGVFGRLETLRADALALAGRYDSGLGDLASAHDRYLAEDLAK